MEKKIKGLMCFTAVAIIAFCIAVCSFIFTKSLVLGILFLVIDILVLIVPYYYCLFLVTEHFGKRSENINFIAENIKIFTPESIDKIAKVDDISKIGVSINEVYQNGQRLKKSSEVLNEILLGAATNPKTDEFLGHVMEIIMDITESSMSSFYSVNKLSGKLELKASRGFGNAIYSQFDISISEGFFGRSVVDGKIKVIENIPNDTIFTVKTFLGDITPKNIMIVPITDEEVIGVLTLTSINSYTQEQVGMLEKVSSYIAYAIKNGTYHEKNERLNNELKFQNQLIQNLNEDLETKIRSRMSFLNATLDSIRDAAIISLDKDNLITLFSKGAEMLFELKEDDVLGRNILTVAENVKEFREKLDKSLFTAINKGYVSEIYEIELMAERKYKLGVEMFAVKGESEKFEGTTVIMRNLSDLARIEDAAKAEEKLSEMLIDESHVALILIDEFGNVIRANKNTEYFLGVTKNIGNSNIADFFEDKRRINNVLDYAVTTKENVSVTEKLNGGMQATLDCMPVSSGSVKKVLIHLH